MEDKKLSGEGAPEFSDMGKWFDNFWYHYKVQTMIAVVALITVIICTVQFFNRETSDYYMMYAGPKATALQDTLYMKKAVESVADDYDGNGEVTVAFANIIGMSPEEIEEAREEGRALSPDFLKKSRDEYYQQIFGGDAVICFLSPYMYEIVHEADGFLPLAEIFDDTPEGAYDECGIVLADTEFGRYFNGMNDLPEDTILCIRRVSTMAVFKGSKKTERAHEANVELFKKIVEFKAPITEE